MWILLLGIQQYVLTLDSVLDRKTFDKMWEMSAPGSEAEHCFMRIEHAEYYTTDREGETVLEVMPEVSDTHA